MTRITTVESHGNRKTMANLGRTGTTNNGRTEIISHGRTKTRSHGRTTRGKKEKPRDHLFLHCHKIKKFFVPADCDENVFQIICTLVKAQIDKAKQSGGNGKEINEISKDTLVNLLNISGETYDVAQSKYHIRVIDVSILISRILYHTSHSQAIPISRSTCL